MFSDSAAEGLDQQAKPLRSRRRRVVLVATAIALAAGAVLATLALRGEDEGPLTVDEENISVTIPIHPGETGIAWGNLELHNPTSSPLTLDSVTLTPASEEELTVTKTYIWAEDRLDIADARTLIAHQLPLPTAWNQVPNVGGA